MLKLKPLLGFILVAFLLTGASPVLARHHHHHHHYDEDAAASGLAGDTLLIIRHAEKPAGDNSGPGLAPAGSRARQGLCGLFPAFADRRRAGENRRDYRDCGFARQRPPAPDGHALRASKRAQDRAALSRQGSEGSGALARGRRTPPHRPHRLASRQDARNF